MKEIKLDDFVQYKELVLEKVKFGLNEYISKSQMEDIRIEKIEDLITDNIIYKIRGYLMGEKLREEKRNWKIKYPSYWWQMFKEQHFPKWLINKFPIKYIIKRRNVTFEIYELYPQFPIVRPNWTREHFPVKICYTEDENPELLR